MTRPQDTPAQRRTRATVHWQDRLAGIVITVGGIGVIAAVLAIGVYLAAVAVPLFSKASVAGPKSARAGSRAPARAMFVDEYGLGALALDEAGTLRWIIASTGQVAGEQPAQAPGKRATAWSWNAEGSLLAIGYDDGTVQFGHVEFQTAVIPAAEVTGTAAGLGVGSSAPWRVTGVDGKGGKLGAVISRISEHEYRMVTPELELSAPVALSHGAGAVERIAYTKSGDAELVVALRADRSMALDRVTTTRPLGGGAPRVALQATVIEAALPHEHGFPDAIYATSDSSDVLVLWRDGLCQRYTDSAADRMPLAEAVRLLPSGRTATSSAMLLGGLTLLVGDDEGTVRAVFAARRPESGTIDGRTLVTAHTLRAFDGPVTCLGISQRSRIIAIGDRAGRIAIRSVASDKEIADLAAPGDAVGQDVGALAPVTAVGLVRSEGLLAIHGDGTLQTWALDPGHPDVSASSLFAPVHYEGQGRAEHTYQSSSASDSAEVKLGLMPLIHGTLKATLFAMIFAVPIAVGGAIYTSEFLHPSWRTRIKPAVEMMASLPSVVLGFVAAMVVAPLVRDVVPEFLAGLVLVPFCVLLGAHLWQLAPGPTIARTGPMRRLWMVGASMLVGVGAAWLVGPALEAGLFRASRSDKLVSAGFYERVPADEWPSWVGRRETMSPDDERHLRAAGLYFRGSGVVRPTEVSSEEDEAKVAIVARAQGIDGGDLLRWLDGSIGGPWPGWFIALIPLGLIAVWVTRNGVPMRALDRWLEQPTEFRAGLARLGFFVLASVAACAVAALGATVLSLASLDPRDLMFGPFNQRNSLVVGIIMGFAIIPIIYTISEDAMSSVPASLRTASLGSGATPWQTAVRVVLPVAASGVFSALMIGLGRAVGETMIVVMATGNTPSMDWSMFSGFRTLSANIAVELPEAPKDSTHYRVLFLCGLALFLMTFLVNTTAEIVRQRVRRRIASL